MKCSKCNNEVNYSTDVICCKRNHYGRTYVYHNDCNHPTGLVKFKKYEERGVNPFFGAKMGIYSL